MGFTRFSLKKQMTIFVPAMSKKQSIRMQNISTIEAYPPKFHDHTPLEDMFHYAVTQRHLEAKKNKPVTP